MIIYSDRKSSFIDDILNGVISDKIKAKMIDNLHRHVSPNEIRSWENSLNRMGFILNTPDIPDDAFISLEYNIPHTAKRVDLIITGSSDNDTMEAVIIELKQWADIVTSRFPPAVWSAASKSSPARISP